MTVLLASSAHVPSDPIEASVFLSAASWVEAVLLGPVATSIAVMAVGSIGLLMLSGRVRIRRGATVILGCFILFGAASIAQGLRGVATSLADTPAPQPVLAKAGPPIALLPPPPQDLEPPPDPYAGASIRR